LEVKKGMDLSAKHDSPKGYVYKQSIFLKKENCAEARGWVA
jgi:hypothetical protein